MGRKTSTSNVVAQRESVWAGGFVSAALRDWPTRLSHLLGVQLTWTEQRCACTVAEIPVLFVVPPTGLEVAVTVHVFRVAPADVAAWCSRDPRLQWRSPALCLVQHFPDDTDDEHLRTAIEDLTRSAAQLF
jgi:hypothetical protein